MPAYQTDLEKFAGFDAQVVGISGDSVYSHIAWQQRSIGRLQYPLASDFYPHGGVAQQYGVWRTGPPIPGINDRSIFVVNKDGKIVFARLYDLGDVPENQEVLNVLKKLQ